MHLYAMPGSGNSYKIQLVAALLGIELTETHMLARDGSTRTADYLAKNPNGKLPLLALDDGQYLPESGAIAFYLAANSALWPTAKLAQAHVLSWMFFEQHSHEPAIAVRRSLSLNPARAAEADPATMQNLLDKGYAALGVMERQLQHTKFLVGDTVTIADIALYAYTHDCHKGGFSLENYPAIATWLRRIEALPGYISMPMG